MPIDYIAHFSPSFSPTFLRRPYKPRHRQTPSWCPRTRKIRRNTHDTTLPNPFTSLQHFFSKVGQPKIIFAHAIHVYPLTTSLSYTHFQTCTGTLSLTSPGFVTFHAMYKPPVVTLPPRVHSRSMHITNVKPLLLSRTSTSYLLAQDNILSAHTTELYTSVVESRTSICTFPTLHCVISQPHTIITIPPPGVQGCTFVQ